MMNLFHCSTSKTISIDDGTGPRCPVGPLLVYTFPTTITDCNDLIISEPMNIGLAAVFQAE